MIPRITPGVWRHYKGNLYRVLFGGADYTGEFTEGEWIERDGQRNADRGFPEGEKLVVYIGLYDNPHGNRECVRPASEFGANLVGEALTPEEWERATAPAKGVLEPAWADEIRRRYRDGKYTGPRYELIGEA